MAGRFSFSLIHSGIMFPIKAKQDVPVSQIVLHSVAVRGHLGPLTVWVTRPDVTPREDQAGGDNANATTNNAKEYRFPLQSRHWQKVYQQVHAPSMREYVWLDFSSNPIVLQPGQVRALYIHSTLPSDEAIVYDNSNHRPHHWHYHRPGARAGAMTTPRYTDNYISLLTGKAHLSPRPFGQTPIWGWGNAWRDHREFVGQVRYGVRYQLWQPALTAGVYGPEFRTAVQTLLACQRRLESPLAMLPDECLYYILNMCKWDWWNDNANGLKTQRRRLQRQAREAAAQAAQERAVAAQQEESTAEPQKPAAKPPVAPKVTDSTAISMETDDTLVDDGGVAGNDQDSEMLPREADNNSDDDDDDDDDDVDDDDEWQEDSDSDAEDSASDGDDWEHMQGYRADHRVFIYRDVSSDEESDEGDDEEAQAAAAAERQAWFRRHFARVHLLRALAQGDTDDQEDVPMRLRGHSDDSTGDENGGDTVDGEENYVPLQDTDEE